MYTSLLHNYWLSNLLVCFHFEILIICVSPCLPYFLKRFHPLLYCCFASNYLFFHFVDVLQILVSLPAPSSIFLPYCFPFHCFEAHVHYYFVSRFPFVLVWRSFGILQYFRVTIFFCNFDLDITYLFVLVLLFPFASLSVFLLFCCLNTFRLNFTPVVWPLLLPLAFSDHHDRPCLLPVFLRDHTS